MPEYKHYENGVEGYPFFTRKGTLYLMGKEPDCETVFYVARIDADSEGKYNPTGKEWHILNIRIGDMLQSLKGQVRSHFCKDDNCFHVPTGHNYDYRVYRFNDYVAWYTHRQYNYLNNPQYYQSKKIRRALHFNAREWGVFVNNLLRVYGEIIKKAVLKELDYLYNG